MRLLAEKRDGVALHAFRAQHDAQRQIHALQHGPLFDVQFE